MSKRIITFKSGNEEISLETTDKSKGSPVRESLLEKAVCQCPPCGLDHGNSICRYGKRVA